MTSSQGEAHDVTLTLLVPATYDDPSADNDARTVSVSPGVDLTLADLDPDNESPFNDDAVHLVTTRLGGVRSGLASVTYTLTGAARFTDAGAGCTVTVSTATCAAPRDGDRTFTVRATDPSGPTDIAIAVTPAGPFVEVGATDNAERTRLLAQPTHDFSLSTLAQAGHTLSADTDTYTVTTTLGAIPDGVPGLTLSLTGGTFTAAQPPGCARTDATHVHCTDLASDRLARLGVVSTQTVAHDLTLSVQLPARYADPALADNSRSLRVRPGVDLSLAALSAPEHHGTDHTFDTRLQGIRPGLDRVTLEVAGATLTGATGTGCSRSGSTVTCTDPVDGRQVGLTVRLADPTQASTVTVTAAAPPPYVELAPSDNARSVTVTPPPPDVVLTSVDVLTHTGNTARVRARVSDVPAGVDTVRFRLDGVGVGTASGETILTGGDLGADGEGDVRCYVSNGSGAPAESGQYVTCTGVTTTSGAFFVEANVRHRHSNTFQELTLTVLPVLPDGVSESATGNNSRTFDLR